MENPFIEQGRQLSNAEHINLPIHPQSHQLASIKQRERVLEQIIVRRRQK